MADEPTQIELTAGARLLGVTETAAKLVGAKLCFGEPVRHGDRTVVPVASVYTAGGLGFESSPSTDPAKDGGGAGGVLGACPVGFIEIADGTARFRRILTAADIVQVAGASAVLALVGRVWRRRR